MKEKARSEYGARLHDARKRAHLTQTALAKRVGMSQSAYAEAETTGHKSMYTAQLASACGVSATWLATGIGPMVDAGTTEARPQADRIADALQVITKALLEVDQDTREAVGHLLSTWAQKPEESAKKSRLLLRLLVTNDDRDHGSEDGFRPAEFSASLGGSLLADVGGGSNGRSGRVASQGGSSSKK